MQRQNSQLDRKKTCIAWEDEKPLSGDHILKVVSSEKVGGSRVTSTLGTWKGGVVMGVLLSFNEAAILYEISTVRRHNNKI